MIHAWTTGVRQDDISFGGSYLGWRWPVAWTPDSPDSIGFTVYDFWKKADPIYADPSSDIWHPNFDAQYKIRNDGSETITVQRLALAIHYSDNSFWFDMSDPSTGQPRYYDNLNLYPGESHHFDFSVAYFNSPGNYKVVAKAQIDNEWHELDSMDFVVQQGATPIHTITPPSNTTVGQGGTLGPIDIEHINNSDSLVEYTVQKYLILPNGETKYRPINTHYIAAWETKTFQIYLNIPSTAQIGTHTFGIKITYPDSNVIDDDYFEFTVTSADTLDIENSGFENAYTGWWMGQAFGTDCTFTIDTDSYEGSKAAKLTVNNDGYCHLSNDTSIPVDQSGEYILSLYAKVMGNSVSYLTIAVWKATDPNSFPSTFVTSNTIIELGTGYKLHQFAVELTSGDYIRLELGIDNSSDAESGYVLFDKIEINKATIELIDSEPDSFPLATPYQMGPRFCDPDYFNGLTVHTGIDIMKGAEAPVYSVC